MTARDLSAFATALSRAPSGLLVRLKRVRRLESFNLVGSTNQQIIDELLSNLERISLVSQRLPFVAKLYCWIARQDLLLSWEVYRVNPFDVTLIYFAPHRRIARALDVASGSVTFVPVITLRARYACIMIPGMEPAAEHRIVCLCVWNNRPFVAVWAAESVGRAHLHSALASALCGNPDELRVGTVAWMVLGYSILRACSSGTQTAAVPQICHFLELWAVIASTSLPRSSTLLPALKGWIVAGMNWLPRDYHFLQPCTS
ncbi:hypothetical protein MTO96_038178 [Rhipicephalus appendiculatus]